MGWLVFNSLHFWNCQITKFHRVWFHPTTLCPSIWTIHLNKSFHRRIAGTTGIEPWPPGQQASVLSISPLPFGHARLDKSYNRDINLICFRVSTKINKCGKNNLFSVNPKPGYFVSYEVIWAHARPHPRTQTEVVALTPGGCLIFLSYNISRGSNHSLVATNGLSLALGTLW